MLTDSAMGDPDIGSNVILGVFATVFPDESNILIGRIKQIVFHDVGGPCPIT